MSIESVDGVCDYLSDSGRFLCNLISTSDMGATSLTGIVTFDTNEMTTGTATFICTGGTDVNDGAIFNVTSVFDKYIVEHTTCIQAP